MAQAARITIGGESFTVQGTREDITALLKPRRLGPEEGFRELRTTDGETITVNPSAVSLITAATTPTKREIGFR